MKKAFFPISSRGFLVVLALLFPSCAKKPANDSVKLVAETERSRHFEAVNRHLELGGPLYGYADIDGDVLKLATSAQVIARNLAEMQPQMAALAKPDFKVLLTDLGFDDVKAIGLSSVPDGGGLYRNRAFLYTPAGRHGLLAVFGGQPAPFVGARLAPADADFYVEHEFDIPAVFETIKTVIGKVSGKEAADAFEQEVRKAGDQAHFSMLDIIRGLKGRVSFVLKLDPVRTVAFKGPMGPVVPAFSALVRVDGIGPAIETALVKDAQKFEATSDGSMHLFAWKGEPAADGLHLVLAVDGAALYVATTPEFLRECLQRTDGLDKAPAFVSALAALGPEGNGLTWVSPRFFSRLRALGEMNPKAPPPLKRMLDLSAANIPLVSQPLLSVRTNLPDGILIRSTWNRTLKADVAALMIYNPVTLGLMAAAAIPAFQNGRANSQAALRNSQAAAVRNSQALAVTNNLRMLNAAAAHYFTQNPGTTVRYEDLVGPDKPIKVLTPVAGEDYRTVVITRGRPLRIVLPDGRMFSFPFAGQNALRPNPNRSAPVLPPVPAPPSQTP